MPAHERGGGLARALQIAAVQGVKALPLELKVARSVFGLGETPGIERDVDMTLEPALCVPGGLAVAHEADRAAR